MFLMMDPAGGTSVRNLAVPALLNGLEKAHVCCSYPIPPVIPSFQNLNESPRRVFY